MSLLLHLRATLNTIFREFDSVTSFTLTEPGNLMGCQQVGIRVQQNSVSVYKLDAIRNHPTDGHLIEKFPFFEGGNPKRICDYVIFYEKNDILYAFLCELKSTSVSGAKNQLCAGFLLSKYFIETTKRCSAIANQRIKFRALLFSTRNVYKDINADTFFTSDGEVGFKELFCNTSYSLDSFCH